MKNEEKKVQCLINIAENFVLLSERLSAFGATFPLRQSYEIYQKIVSSCSPERKEQLKTRRDEIYARLLNAQQGSLNELVVYKKEIDLTKEITKTFSQMQGKSLREALFTLAFELTEPPNYQELERQAKQLIENHISYDEYYLGQRGEIVAHPDSEDNETQLATKKFFLAKICHQVATVGRIEPARSVINLEHFVEEKDLLLFLKYHPLISDGREYLYAKGLHAGLMGDFITATHLVDTST